jgi:hypothetical protein
MCTHRFAGWQGGTGSLAPTLAAFALAGALALLGVGPSVAQVGCVDYADYMHWVASAPLADDYQSGFDFGGSCIVGDYLYLTAGQYGAKVFDIANRAHPRLVAELPSGSYVWDVEVRGDYAYLTGYAFYVVDISTPENPQLVGVLESWDSRDIALVGDYALVTQWGSGVDVIDVSDPSHPVQVSSVNTGYCRGICVVGDIACVAAGDLMSLVDVSDPIHPEIVGVLETFSDAFSVTAAGSLALLYEEPDGGGGILHVVDISVPQSPQILSSLDYDGRARGLAIMGDLAFITRGGLQALDLSDPAHPARLGRAYAGSALSVALAAPYAYVTDGNNRVHVIDISNPMSAPMVGRATTAGVPVGVCVDADLAFVAEALPGYQGLLEIFAVADPATPQLLGEVATPGWAYDVAVRAGYAYVLDSHSTNPGTGLQVIDISDPTQPTIVNSLPLSTADAIVIVDALAYIANYSSGLRILDLSDPLNPWIVSQTSLAGWPTDVAVVGDVAYVAMAGSWVGFQTVDISDPVHPQILGTATDDDGNALGQARCVAVQGSIAYITDHGDAYGSGSDSLLLAIDVSDPEQPRLLATLPVCIVGSHGQYGFRWDLIAADGSLYLASNGLNVVDVTSSHVWPYQMRLVGGWGVGQATCLALTTDHLFMVSDEWPNGSLHILPRQCSPQPAGVADGGPPAAALLTAHPNPFNPGTTLSFAVPSTGRTTLAIYDARGREVVTLVDEKLTAGMHRRDWTGCDAAGRRLPSGVYLCRLTTPGGVGAEKLVMLQ